MAARAKPAAATAVAEKRTTAPSCSLRERWRSTAPFRPDTFWGYIAPTLMTLWVRAVAITAQRLRSR